MSIRSEFYTESHGIILTIDLSDPTSFETIDSWLKEIKKFGGEKLPIMVLGNKADKKKMVSMSDVEKLCSKFKFPYFEVSSSNLVSIITAMTDFANKLSEKESKKK